MLHCSRRIGKSSVLLNIANEIGQTERCIMRYGAATQKDVREMILPLMDILTRTAPPHLKPVWHEGKGKFIYPKTTSELVVSGLDEGRADNLRGTAMKIGFIDEAGFVEDLDYAIKSVLMPQLLTTNGRLLLASSSPRSPSHPFTALIEEAKHNDAYCKMTIHEDSRHEVLARIEEWQKEAGGATSTTWRREYLCVDRDTLVKTAEGYKKISEVRVGDLVLTHMGRFRRVRAVMASPTADRDVYNLKTSNNLGIKLTGDHRVLVRKTDYSGKFERGSEDWMTIIELRKHFKSQKDHRRVWIRVAVSKEPLKSDVSPELAEICGWYVAEGGLSKTQQQAVFSLSEKDPGLHLSELCYRVFGKGLSPGQNYIPTVRQWALNSKHAKTLLKSFGVGAWNKKIPKWIFAASESARWAFIKAYFAGDGCVVTLRGGSPRISCITVSETLAHQIVDLLASLGVAASIQRGNIKKTQMIMGRRCNTRPSFQVTVGGENVFAFGIDGKKPTYTKSIFRDGFVYAGIESIEKIEGYDESHLYDLEVEEDHSYTGLGCTFHNCEIITDAESALVPEFDDKKATRIVRDWERPPHFIPYTIMDLGYIDFTAVVFGYVDFLKAKFVVEDEILLNRKDSKAIADAIKAKEKELWGDSTRVKRVADGPLLTVTDFNSLHNLPFNGVAKDELEAQVNQLRLAVQSESLIIHPRCLHTVSHLKYGVWDKAHKKFDRSSTYGHYDCVASLMYFVRSADLRENPYPENWGMTEGSHYISKPTNQDPDAQNLEQAFLGGLIK